MTAVLDWTTQYYKYVSPPQTDQNLFFFFGPVYSKMYMGGKKAKDSQDALEK